MDLTREVCAHHGTLPFTLTHTATTSPTQSQSFSGCCSILLGGGRGEGCHLEKIGFRLAEWMTGSGCLQKHITGWHNVSPRIWSSHTHSHLLQSNAISHAIIDTWKELWKNSFPSGGLRGGCEAIKLHLSSHSQERRMRCRQEVILERYIFILGERCLLASLQFASCRERNTDHMWNIQN